MNPEIEAHLRSLVSFPSPPGVASHIIELARDPEIEMGKVAKVLSLDSALSSKVLRIANSPLYAQRRKSENLRQALVVLGLNATLTLALSFSLVKTLRTGKANGIDYPHYWRRALVAATAARALADALRQPMAEEIFLAALLQDVGILALDQALPELYRGADLDQRDHRSLAEIEKRRLNADHAEIGAWLMESWNLPPRLFRAISHSHRVDLSVTNDAALIFQRCVAQSGPIADLFLREPQQRPFAEVGLAVERSLDHFQNAGFSSSPVPVHTDRDWRFGTLPQQLYYRLSDSFIVQKIDFGFVVRKNHGRSTPPPLSAYADPPLFLVALRRHELAEDCFRATARKQPPTPDL